MHSVDQTTEQMIRSVLAYAENRLRLDPVPLDRGTQAARDARDRFGGLLGEKGADPDQVLGIYTSVIAPERHLRRQPAVPRLHPGGADEGQPAVRHARLVRLHPGHLLARGVRRRRGREHGAAAASPTRPACRRPRAAASSRGGSAGNLSALAVARETAKERLAGDAQRRRLRVVVGTDAHSSIVNTLRLLEMDALVVRTAGPPAHRRRGARGDRRGRRPWPTWPPSSARRARRTPASSTTSPGSARSPASTAGGSTSTAPTAGPASSRRSLRHQVRRHRARRLVHPRPAQVAVHAVRLLRADLPGAGAGPRRRTPRTRPTST